MRQYVREGVRREAARQAGKMGKVGRIGTTWKGDEFEYIFA